MTTARPAYLYDGVRTPFGKYRGAFASMPSIDLGQYVVKELLRRHDVANRLDAILMGVVLQAGLGQNPARTAALYAGVDSTTPGITLNNVCLASLEAACDATRRIHCGEGEAYLVGGFDSMSHAPWFLPSTRDGRPDTDAEALSVMKVDGLTCTLACASQGELSDRINRVMGISREAQDNYAVLSQLRAEAISKWREQVELVAVPTSEGVIAADQGIRQGTTATGLSLLKPAFGADGTITAGNASQMADGASAGLVVSLPFAERLGAAPLARIVDWAWVAGPDPSLHLKPADAIEKVLQRNSLRVSDIDLYEINEAFAGVTIASMTKLSLPIDVVNVHGGAIALGHPLGATGFRLLLTLALALRQQDLRRGIVALCGGGGQGLAVLIESV